MNDKITPGQILSLQSALREIYGMVDGAHVYIVNALVVNQDIEALEDLERSNWIILRNQLYPNWWNADWTLDRKMKRQIANLFAQYREEITGQLRLF